MVTETGVLAAAVLVVAAAALVIAWQARRAAVPRDEPGGIVLLQQQLDALRTQLAQALAGQAQAVGQQLTTLTGQLNERLRESGEMAQRSQATLGERLDNAARVVGEVQRGLGELREATARVYDVGRDVATLHDILRAPKLRGGFGEFLLGDLLAQVLPSAHYTLQYGFRSGERVDAIVRLGNGIVPIDAKFPLEDFRRLLQAPDEDERARARRGFIARVRKHVDDVAGKYIVPDEGTFDFALMYIPAENVYYETIVRDDELGGDRGLAAYALERKVIPVSPNCFYAYLQAIALGLRGLRIEEHAEEVLGRLGRLTADVGRFRDEFRLLGKHLGHASQAHAQAERRLDRLAGTLETITGVEEEEATAPVPVQRTLLRVT